MSYSHEHVIRMFADGLTNKRGSRVFSEGDTLYSHGHHFELAVKRQGQDNLKDHEPWFLLNGDKYSMSTSTHQHYTFKAFRAFPRVSFTAIGAARLSSQRCLVVDWVSDQSAYTYKGDADFETFEQRMPAGATLSMPQKDGEISRKSWHRIGSAVLRHPYADVDYLCSMDEGSYFVSQLPWQVSRVSDAFAALIPERVQAAMNAGVPVRRQGEWFCLPIGRTLPLGLKKRAMTRAFELPRMNDDSNTHLCTAGLSHDGRHFIAGRIRHVRRSWQSSDWESTHEHRPLVLEKNMVYEAIKNTSLGDWSSHGRVD